MLREVVVVRKPARFAVVKKGGNGKYGDGVVEEICGFERHPFECKSAMLPLHAPCFALLENGLREKEIRGKLRAERWD